MLRTIYLVAGGLMIFGYVGWSALGWELGSWQKERVPTVKAVRSSGSSGYYGRSRSGYYGGGFGFGK
jgi:hypothetical protein